MVIGAGPTGIYAYQQLQRAFGTDAVCLVERTGLVANIKKYPPQLWHSPMHELIFPDTSGNPQHFPTNGQVVDYYTKYFHEHGMSIIHDEVEQIRATDGSDGADRPSVQVTMKSGSSYRVNIVVICTGIFDNKRELPLEVPEGLSYQVRHGYPDDFEMEGKHMVLVGGGNSAVDYFNHFIGKNRVTWIMRGGGHVNPPGLQRQLLYHNMRAHKDRIIIYARTEVIAFHKHGIELSNGTTVSPVDHCNVFIGFHGKHPLVEQVAKFNDKGNPVLYDQFRTEVPGVYLYGACNNPEKFSIDNWIKPQCIQPLIDCIKRSKI